jgi:ferredoxin
MTIPISSAIPARRGLSEPPPWLLRVDPILCRAHGLCAELIPEVVDLDEWGYAMVHRAVPPLILAEARAAVAACPTLALRLVRGEPTR